MKVLMVHQGAELYGSDRSFVSSVKAVSSICDVSIDVILPSDGDLYDLLLNDVNNVFFRPEGYLRKAAIKKNPFKSLLGIAREILWCRGFFKKYDVVYINTVVCISAIISLAFFSSVKKKIVHVREIPTGLQLVFFKMLLKLSGAELVYNSEATRSSFSGKGAVVLNGVPSVVTSNKKSNCGAKNKFLLIGRINAWKGQDLFLKSILPLIDSIEIRIVGGVYSNQFHFLDELHDILKNHNANVTFFDFCGDPSEHYEWADYVVVPSKLPEPFGRVAIEGMSSGAPVIAAAHGGLCEIIDDGVDGFLFEPNNQADLLKVVSKAIGFNNYREISINARLKYLDKFSEDAYKKNFLNAIGLQ
jgi:glycosyltransferase involved in cell wall biosynthesis